MGSQSFPVFYNCTKLTNVIIGDNVKAIPAEAFNRCTSLTSVTIPLSVTSIGVEAFCSCTGLTSIIIPSSVISIGNSAFNSCTGLTSIIIPSSVTSIANTAFLNCPGILTVDANNPNYTSQDGLLYNKTKSKLIHCPISKTGNFIIPSSVTSIGDWAFYSCTGLTSITIPPSVTSIGSCAFSTCKGLMSITIPASVTSIDNSAFALCTGLTSITIPASVTSIGSYSFDGCTGLTSIYTYATVPVDLSNRYLVFNDINKTTCTLFVPKGLLSVYKAAASWLDFINIVEFDATAVNNPKDNELKVFYNQATGSLLLNGIDSPVSVSVYDLKGLLWLSHTVSDYETMSVQSLPRGIYVVKAVLNNKVVSSKVVI